MVLICKKYGFTKQNNIFYVICVEPNTIISRLIRYYEYSKEDLLWQYR